MDWYPWYFAIYEADAGHLSCLEDGAYRRLIDRYMRTQAPLPDDDAALARFVGLSLDEWLGIAPRIRPFFQARSGKLHNKRCNQELDKQVARSKIRSETARKGGLARQLKYREDLAQSKLSASSKQIDGQTPSQDLGPKNADFDNRLSQQANSAHAQLKSATGQDKTRQEGREESRSSTSLFPETPTPSHTPAPGRVNGSGRDDDPDRFEEFWGTYPSRAPHPNPKKPARLKFAAIVKGGTSPDVIIAGAARYAKYAASERTDPRYIAQATTWLNQARWTEPYELRARSSRKPMAFEGDEDRGHPHPRDPSARRGGRIGQALGLLPMVRGKRGPSAKSHPPLDDGLARWAEAWLALQQLRPVWPRRSHMAGGQKC